MSDPSCVTTKSKFAALINIAVLETVPPPQNQLEEAGGTKQSALHVVSNSDYNLYTIKAFQDIFAIAMLTSTETNHAIYEMIRSKCLALLNIDLV